METKNEEPDFLGHDVGDSVAVAVRDLTVGEVHGGYLSSAETVAMTLREDVPLGHKIALTDLDVDADVIEYGVRIGVTTQPISRGSHVHVHNVRSARWQSSRA